MFLAILHFSKVLPLIKTRVGTGPPVLAERHILRSFSCELFGSNLRLDKDEIFTNQKVYFMPIKCICRLFSVKHFFKGLILCSEMCKKQLVLPIFLHPSAILFYLHILLWYPPFAPCSLIINLFEFLVSRHLNLRFAAQVDYFCFKTFFYNIIIIDSININNINYISRV